MIKHAEGINNSIKVGNRGTGYDTAEKLLSLKE
jgi:hypothetical protein